MVTLLLSVAPRGLSEHPEALQSPQAAPRPGPLPCPLSLSPCETPASLPLTGALSLTRDFSRSSTAPARYSFFFFFPELPLFASFPQCPSYPVTARRRARSPQPGPVRAVPGPRRDGGRPPPPCPPPATCGCRRPRAAPARSARSMAAARRLSASARRFRSAAHAGSGAAGL